MGINNDVLPISIYYIA